MTLPSSGQLSLTQIQGEFGGTGSIGLKEYYAGGLYVSPGTLGYPNGTATPIPSSPSQISISNFYGATAVEGGSAKLVVGNGTFQNIVTLPSVATWIYVKMTGAGGGGGGGDASRNGGSGGGGSYTSAIVRLPATTSTKVISGGIGLGGSGTDETTRLGGAGGDGFSFPMSGFFSGLGGQGGTQGPSGNSGSGGGGGGSTALIYMADSVTVPILAVAGAGGGGGAGRDGSAGNGNQSNYIPNVKNINVGPYTNSLNGQPGANGGGDQGAGGGGGGGGGLGGTMTIGSGSEASGTGGSAGYSIQNTALTWNYYIAFDSTSTTPQPANREPYYGYGGTGDIRTAAFGVTPVSGSPGAISLFWSTSPSVPESWSQSVPEYGLPSLNVSLPAANPPTGSPSAFIQFTSSGQINSADSAVYEWSRWLTPLTAGAGGIYEIRVTQIGGTIPLDAADSSPQNTWLSLSAERIWYSSSPSMEIQTTIIRVEIRSASTGTIVASRVWTLSSYAIDYGPPSGGDDAA